ncbi:secretory carrier-associated membrane protein 1 [Grus japonensis]|uniref:Secretory carrier-associated membrane protein 1 n=1 Tax=Grus japonensis TaxID=30415 RepID=A0ABC9YJS7_GRUJA
MVLSYWLGLNHDRGGQGAPGTRAEIPLQAVEKTMVRQAVPLQPMEVNGGADIHLQPMEDPMPEQPPPGNAKMPNVPSTQPAIMKPTEEPPAYTQIAKEHALAQAELLKRQEELERKAAELDRREREMQSLNQQGDELLAKIWLKIEIASKTLSEFQIKVPLG